MGGEEEVRCGRGGRGEMWEGRKEVGCGRGGKRWDVGGERIGGREEVGCGT